MRRCSQRQPPLLAKGQGDCEGGRGEDAGGQAGGKGRGGRDGTSLTGVVFGSKRRHSTSPTGTAGQCSTRRGTMMSSPGLTITSRSRNCIVIVPLQTSAEGCSGRACVEGVSFGMGRGSRGRHRHGMWRWPGGGGGVCVCVCVCARARARARVCVVVVVVVLARARRTSRHGLSLGVPRPCSCRSHAADTRGTEPPAPPAHHTRTPPADTRGTERGRRAED